MLTEPKSDISHKGQFRQPLLNWQKETIRVNAFDAREISLLLNLIFTK